MREALAAIERRMIIQALKTTGNETAAARYLGLPRTSLIRRMVILGLRNRTKSA
jgi:DNA-binding NtrC family response regulator